MSNTQDQSNRVELDPYEADVESTIEAIDTRYDPNPVGLLDRSTFEMIIEDVNDGMQTVAEYIKTWNPTRCREPDSKTVTVEAGDTAVYRLVDSSLWIDPIEEIIRDLEPEKKFVDMDVEQVASEVCYAAIKSAHRDNDAYSIHAEAIDL